MRAGIITSIWSVYGIPLAASLRQAGDLGFRHVDVFARGHGDPGHLSGAERRQVQAVARQVGITVSGVVSLFEYNTATPDPELRARNWEYMRAAMDMAEELEARQLLFIAGEREFDLPMSEAWKRSVDFAVKCTREAERRGLVLTLEFEPHVRCVTHDLPTSLRYLQEVNSAAFRFNLDTGHASIVRASPEELTALAPYTVHLHLSDNGGSIDSHDDLGSGTCPNQAYVAALQKYGIEETCRKAGLDEAVATVELNYGMVLPLLRGTPAMALRKVLDYLSREFPELSLTQTARRENVV